MKKVFTFFAIAAAFVACNKVETSFEESSEIGFAPVAGKITKAALNSAVYPTDDHIAIWSNYAQDVNPGAVADWSKFSTAYLDNVKFVHKSNAWGGETPYYWPTNGSLVFAGYSVKGGSDVNANATYNFSTDEMKIPFTQATKTASTYDLLWFGRTESSYNFRNTENAVPVQFNHALTWITINVKGEGSAIAEGNPWTITSVKLNGVNYEGTATLKGADATWALAAEKTAEMDVFSGNQPLTAAAAAIETTERGTVILPQTPVTLTVSYKYKTPAGAEITESKTLSLKLDDADTPWAAKTHYTYTLTFKSNEILVAPKVNTWVEDADNAITVE